MKNTKLLCTGTEMACATNLVSKKCNTTEVFSKQCLFIQPEELSVEKEAKKDGESKSGNSHGQGTEDALSGLNP